MTGFWPAPDCKCSLLSDFNWHLITSLADRIGIMRECFELSKTDQITHKIRQ